MAWLEGGIAWKLQYIREVRREVGRLIFEACERPERAWELPGLARRLIELDSEAKAVTGRDRGKAFDLVKANLEKEIATAERLLHDAADPAVRKLWQEEIGAYRSLLGGLLAEGRPK